MSLTSLLVCSSRSLLQFWATQPVPQLGVYHAHINEQLFMLPHR